MIRIFKLVFLLVLSQVTFAQVPSNYTNINGRYRWIAGMFDSTFHIPKGSTPSLRTGGSTNAGALFYKTGDSSLYIYSGTQWLKIAGASGFVPYSGATQNVNLGIYDILAKSATIADTGGIAATITQRTSINTDMALYAKTVGNRGFAAIFEQSDSNATGTQYQTIFRKSMMPGTGNPAPGAGVSWYTQISNDNNNNPAVSVYRARIIDSTGYASGLIKQTSTEFWTRKNNVWDTTLVLNGGNVGINTGQNGIDSALTVANGTWFKRGVRMSALPTGVGTKALRIDANGNVSTTDTTATTGYVPYTGATQDLDMGTFSVNAKSFHIKGTAGQGHLGLKHQTATPSVSSNESGVYADVNGDLGLKNDNLYTSIFKTSLNSADRTYTFQNKSYTVGDSSDIAARVKYTDTASMLSPYFRLAGVGLKNTGQTVYADTLLLSTRAWRQKGIDSLQANINLKLNISDTASMLSPYLRSNVASATYVPLTRTITINGTSQDLSANRTYNVGTVTSVATNTGTGITGGTITSSGTIAADTLLLSTRAWRQKGVDSVASLINTRISGTTNYIPKFTGSTSVGNSGMYDNSGNIGVGTITPARIFSVYSTSSIPVRIETNTSDTKIEILTTSGTQFIQGSANNLLFGTNNSERMRLDASGNLGINTSSPTAKLTVSGTTSDQIRVYEVTDATNYYRIGRNSTTGFLDFYGNQSGYVGYVWGGINGTRMTLDASGNLGLGVSPQTWTGTNNKAFQFGNSGALANSATFGTVLFNNSYYNAGYKYLTTANASAYVQDGSTHIWYQAESGTAGTAISFTQAMTLFSTGNLAVGGTSDNGNRLNITGNGYFSGGVTVGTNFNVNSSYIGNADATTGRLLFGDGNAANAALRMVTNSTSVFYVDAVKWGSSASEVLLSFQTNGGTTHFGGNVGIGTTSPTANLDVIGGTGYSGDFNLISQFRNPEYATTEKGILLGYSSSTNASILASAYGGGTGALAFWTHNGSTWGERMRITSGGNVAVGSTNADPLALGRERNLAIVTTGTNAALTIVGGVASRIDFGIGGTRTAGIYSDVSNFTEIFTTTALPLVFSTNSSERMRITSGGQVGIGTSNPTVNLQLQAASSPEMRITDGTIGYQMYAQTGSNDLVLGTYTNHNLLFRTNAVPRMQLSAAGELLINTTSDAGDYKLQVNGAIYGTYDITLNSYPGYGSGSSNFYYNGTDSRFVFNANLKANNGEFNGSIKTAAPSGGTAKPWKLGEAGVAVGGANLTAVKVEIDGTIYYLLTAYLPEPEPDPAALPSSGPSASYKPYNKPIPVKTTKDVEIENLRKEIEELKQLIKNK